ncbi:MAG: GtrA family protein [Paenibacillus sp.]|nr:GtrA family protein [Paenibacillus sp.]
MFGMIGVLNTAIDFGAFGLLTWLSVHYAVAQALSYIAGMVNSYLLNNAITFRSARSKESGGFASALRQQLRFLLWNGAMLALSIMLMSAAIGLLGWSAWLAKAAVTVFILGLNFYGSKKWVFTSARGANAAETGGQS